MHSSISGVFIPEDNSVQVFEINLPFNYNTSIKNQLLAPELKAINFKKSSLSVYSVQGAHTNRGKNDRATQLLKFHNRSAVHKYPIYGDAILADFDSDDSGKNQSKNVTIAQYESFLEPVRFLSNFPEEFTPQNFTKKPRAWLEEYEKYLAKGQIFIPPELKEKDNTRGHRAEVQILALPNKEFVSGWHPKLADAKDEACFHALLYIKHHEDEITNYHANPPPPSNPPVPKNKETTNNNSTNNNTNNNNSNTKEDLHQLPWGELMDEGEDEEEEEEDDERVTELDKKKEDVAKEIVEDVGKAFDALNDNIGWEVIVDGVWKKVQTKGTDPVRGNCKLKLHFTSYLKNMEIIYTTRTGKPELVETYYDKEKVRVQTSVLMCIQFVVPTMKKGERAYVMSAPDFAFGKHGDVAGGIPANSRILVDLELVDIRSNENIAKGANITPLDRVTIAKEKKEIANTKCKEQIFKQALSTYREALSILAPKHFKKCSDKLQNEMEQLTAELNLNCAFVHIKLSTIEIANSYEHYKQTVICCTKVLEFQPENTKALFRRFIAYKSMNEIESAEEDINKAAKLNPTDASIREGIREVHQLKAKYAKNDSALYSQMMSKLSVEPEKGNSKPAKKPDSENSNDYEVHSVEMNLDANFYSTPQELEDQIRLEFEKRKGNAKK